MRSTPLIPFLLAAPTVGLAQSVAVDGDGPAASVEVFATDGEQLGVAVTVGESRLEYTLPNRFRDETRLTVAQWVDVELPVLSLQFDASDDRSLVAALLVDERHPEVLAWGRNDVDRTFRLSAIDLDNNGSNELLADTVVSGASVCGHDGVGLQPMVLDSHELRMRPVGIRFAFAPLAETSMSPGPAPARLFDAAPVRVVSSDSAAPIPETWAPAPTALDDGDATTVWRDGAPGDGRGQFVSGAVLAGANLAGISLTTAGDGTRRWLLTTEAGDFVLQADGAGAFTFALPAPLPSRCFSLVALDTADDGAFALAELSAFADVDLLDSNTVLDAIFSRADSDPDGLAAFDGLLRSARFDVTPWLASRLDTAETGADAQSIADLLASTERGTSALLDRLRSSDLDAERAAMVARAVARSGHDIDGLIDLALERDATSTSAIVALSQLGPLARASEFAAIAGTGDQVERDLIINIIASGPAPSADALIAELDGRDESARIDLLRATMRVVQRGADASASDCAPLEAAAHSTQGSEARLAIAVGVAVNCASVVSYATSMVADDPEPMMRATAVTALAALTPSQPLVLEALTADESPDVRLAAARALRDEVVAPELRAQLAEALQSETWPEIRRHLARVLVAQDSAETDQAVLDRMAASDDSELRTLLRVFSNRTSPVDAAAFLTALDAAPREPASLAIATALLARSNGAAASERLTSWCLDMQPEVAPAACEAAARRGLTTVREHVENLARTGALDDRLWALRAVAAYGDDDSRTLLTSLLADETEPDVRAALERLLQFSVQTDALQQLRDELAPPSPIDLGL